MAPLTKPTYAVCHACDAMLIWFHVEMPSAPYKYILVRCSLSLQIAELLIWDSFKMSISLWADINADGVDDSSLQADSWLSWSAGFAGT